MDALRIVRVETAVDAVAAAIFAAATGYAAALLLPSAGAAAVSAALAFAVALLALRAVPSVRPRFALASFELQPILLEGPEELILTDSDRIDPARAASEELVLDDILGELAPDARVVRLFDPAGMPTPGQLQGSIERHLGGARRTAPADASHELLQALADLRRSLR